VGCGLWMENEYKYYLKECNGKKYTTYPDG
jgi:hypothetical protein